MNKKFKSAYASIFMSAMLSAVLIPVYGQDTAQKSGDALVPAISYTSENLRDPFESYVVEEVAPMTVEQIVEEDNIVLPTLTVSGITWGSSFPQAIINDKVVKPGDMINDVKVVSIAKEGLVFLYMNKKFIVPAPASGGEQVPAGSHRWREK